jgi:hypothetical protein
MSTATPDAWARDKAARAISIWNGVAGVALRDMVPLAFPGADPTAFVGFMCNAGQRENTTENVPAQRFHEGGWFGTEMGSREGPAPNPDPHAPDNAWGREHAHPLVVTMLGGRSATMRPDGWKDAPRDQVAVGLVNLLHHADSAFAGLDVLKPATHGSLWDVAVGFMGWSAGSPRTHARLAVWRDALAAVPEAQRWQEFVRLASTGKPGPSGHGNVAYSALRTLQKLEAGRQTAARAQLPVDWYVTLDPVLVATIVRHASGRA